MHSSSGESITRFLKIDSNAPEVLRTNIDDITYLFAGYDGQIFLRGNGVLQQFGISLKESRVQQLPRMFRRYPGNYSMLLKVLFAAYLLFRDRDELTRRIRRRVGRLSRST